MSIIQSNLVTGAGGFIGSHLVDDQLSRGRKVTALDLNLDRLRHQSDNPMCRLVKGDVRDKGLLESLVPEHEVVFHLASAHLEVNQPPSYFEEINIDAVGGLVDICQRSNINRLVHCSSVGVYGSLRSFPADERTECIPTIDYSRSKLAGENALRAAASDLDYVILRPTWVYGSRCPRTRKLFQAIKRKRFVMVGSGQVYRHPLFITDMLMAFEQAATVRGATGQTIIIGGSDAILLDQLIEEISRAVNIDYRPATIPLALMAPLCFLVEKLWSAVGREPPFSTRSLKFFTESSAFDISKARNLLGFTPEVSLSDGLARTAEDLVKEGLL